MATALNLTPVFGWEIRFPYLVRQNKSWYPYSNLSNLEDRLGEFGRKNKNGLIW